ncbi:MAG TPA: hypothetical protein VLA37_04070 [Sphingomonadaceae bacterium]|nr:hypothetical protein [Sphingomonadaceae bacterium]
MKSGPNAGRDVTLDGLAPFFRPSPRAVLRAWGVGVYVFRHALCAPIKLDSKLLQEVLGADDDFAVGREGQAFPGIQPRPLGKPPDHRLRRHFSAFASVFIDSAGLDADFSACAKPRRGSENNPAMTAK